MHVEPVHGTSDLPSVVSANTPHKPTRSLNFILLTRRIKPNVSAITCQMAATSSTTQTMMTKQQRLVQRARVTTAIRAFFDSQDFLEVDTAVAVEAPAPELYIDAPEVTITCSQPDL